MAENGGTAAVGETYLNDVRRIAMILKLWLCSIVVCGSTLLGAAYATDIDPEDFTTNIDNPYYPLVPGTTFFYEGEKDGSPASDEVYVTHDTKVILGVTTRVVRDRAFVDGELVEETFDWYAQDEKGNVWYFGEDATEYENGVPVSHEGSWEAGVDNAEPGKVMLAHPRKGRTYRQEFAPGVAEDMATVLSINKKVTVPFGTFRHCVTTKDFSPLNPGVVEQKDFAPGVGFIRSVMVSGGDEYTELVDITTE